MRKFVRKMRRKLYWGLVSFYIRVFKWGLGHMALKDRLDFQKKVYDNLIKEAENGSLFAVDVLEKLNPIMDQYLLINLCELTTYVMKC